MTKQGLHSYTDGSCPKNPGPGGWAFAIVLEGYRQENILDSGYEPNATNNTMELMAGIRCMERLLKENLHKKHILFVHSDSRYVVTGMQVWRHDWAFNNFKTMTNINGKEVPVKNAELWKEAHDVAEQFEQIRFEWMRGHTGHFWNERCDKMAGAAVKHGNRTHRSMIKQGNRKRD